MEVSAEALAEGKKGKGLRRKISRFFSNDQPVQSAETTASTNYRPLSLATTRDSESVSFSDIFDEAYNAARGSLHSGHGPQSSARSPYHKTTRASISAPPGDSVSQLSPQNRGITGFMRAAPPSLPVLFPDEPPALIYHPAVRDDPALQARLTTTNLRSECVPNSDAPTLSLAIPPLPVRRSRLAQMDASRPHGLPKAALSASGATRKTRLVTEESHAVVAAGGPQDLGLWPAFDRTVDVTWYQTAKEKGGVITPCSMSRPSDKFEYAATLFVARYAKGRPSIKYDMVRRFPYFDLPKKVRFEVAQHLVAETHSIKPILLNSKHQAYPVWPDDAFVSLGSVLRPLQAILETCPHLRADVMAVLLLTRKFHVIFSPFVKEHSQPLPTKWLFRYLHLMQDVSLELDMTKLGFGYSSQSTAMDPQLHSLRYLVHRFTAAMLTRNPANSVGYLTLHCRRYFGYRQGSNIIQDPREGVSKYPLNGGEQDALRGLDSIHCCCAQNYNRQAPSLPPSAAKSYSGHLRHHADKPYRVPYVTEDQLSFACQLRKLVGRVDSVRMVGFSEDWTYETHLALWSDAEPNAVLDVGKHHHIDRSTPSRHMYAAPGHAVYLDYGIEHGLHRYPPLPDSQPLVYVTYNRKGRLFIEVGSGKVVSVNKNVVDILSQSSNPPPPSCVSFPAPEHSGPGPFASCPSRIPTPHSRFDMSTVMQAIRNSTPLVAATLLELPVTKIETAGIRLQERGDKLSGTPTKARSINLESSEG